MQINEPSINTAHLMKSVHVQCQQQHGTYKKNEYNRTPFKMPFKALSSYRQKGIQ
jgi:hypothetical protein